MSDKSSPKTSEQMMLRQQQQQQLIELRRRRRRISHWIFNQLAASLDIYKKRRNKIPFLASLMRAPNSIINNTFRVRPQ